MSNSSNKSTTEPVDCLASGTKITMADGSIKNIESVKEGDFILTFNHFTGKYEGQKVYLTYKGETEKTAFTLNFSDGNKLSVIGDHALFEKESKTYVSLFETNADSFIGKHFYNASSNDYVKLLSVTYETEPTEYYEIYTEYNANCIAENMLNAPYDVINFLVIFDYNNDLTINKQEFEQDISKYGLYKRPDDAEYSYELFDALNWKYANIIVGKGLATWEELFAGRDEFLKKH